MKREHALENQIGTRKRVRVADGPEADIFGRPCAEPFGLEQRFPKSQRILRFGKRNSPGQDAPAEFLNGLPAGAGCLDRPEIGMRQDFRAGKQAHFLSRYWMHDLIAIVAHELSDQI